MKVLPCPRQLVVSAIFACCMLAVLNCGCRKTDLSRQPLHDNAFRKQFFKTSSANPLVLKVISNLEAQDERTGFVSKLPKDCGLPVWDKIVLSTANGHTRVSRNTANGNLEEDSSQTIIIPLTVNNENLSSLIIAHPQPGGYDVDCFTTNNSLYLQCYQSGDIPAAENLLGLFMYMENRTWGTTRFYNIPLSLYPNIAGTPLPNNTKSIEIYVPQDSSTSGFYGLSCWVVKGPYCNCADPTNCDWRSGCSTCSAVYCVNPDDGGTGGGSGGGGGGNTGTGGGSGSGGQGGSGGGGAGGTGSGGTGGGDPCVPAFGNEAWYSNIVMPPNPCDPPPVPEDSMPVLQRLHLFFTAINHTSDSLFQKSMMLPQRERGFIIVRKNGVIYAKNIQVSPDENSVEQVWYLAPGENLLGQGHTHQDPSPDTLSSNYSTNYQLAGIEAVLSVIGLSSNSGIGLYKSNNSYKTEFTKLN